MQIQILSTSVTTKTNTKGKAYQELEVAYKNLTFNGKVEAKKLFDFGAQADTYKVMATAKGADVYEIDVVKNNAGYNDWVKATKGSAGADMTAKQAATHSTPSTSSTTKGGWETPEERAKKQIYIVRQSSISAAVNALSVGVKSPPKSDEVIAYARELESYVFESDKAQAVASKDVGSIEELDEDLPF